MGELSIRFKPMSISSRASAPLLVLALLLLSIVLSVCICGKSAYATDNAKITIDNTVDGQTYRIYRILDLKVAGDPTKPSGYAYTANAGWKDFLSSGAGSPYVNISKAGNVTFKGSDEAAKASNAKQLAKAAIAYAKNNGPKPVASLTDNVKSSSSLTFAGLPFGYYLVDSSTGSLCSLNTTSSTITISDKTTAPSLKKMVSDSSIPTENEVTGENGCNNAALGDVVSFRMEIKVGNGPVNYVLHDTMDKGLTFDPSSVVVKKDTNILESGKAYTLNSSTGDGCTFEISFAKDSHGSNTQLVDGATYVVEYKASVNKSAIVSQVGGSDTGNKNVAHVSYGDDSNLTSNVGETHTYVLSLPVYKFSNIPSDNTPLKGAKFVLKNSAGWYFQKKNELTTWVSDVSGATVFETNDEGKVTIEGIDEGVYELIETESPIGYNKLDDPVAVTVKNVPSTKAGDAERYVSKVLINGSAGPLRIENQTGGIFPGTGGPGAFLIAAGGLLFVLLGVFASVVVWRRGAQNDSKSDLRFLR